MALLRYAVALADELHPE